MWVAVAIVGGSVAFLLFVWVVVSVIRMWRPEQSIPLQRDPAVKRKYRIRSGEPMLLQFGDIRDLERNRKAVFPGDDGGLLADDPIVADWTSDLEMRRN